MVLDCRITNFEVCNLSDIKNAAKLSRKKVLFAVFGVAIGLMLGIFIYLNSLSVHDNDDLGFDSQSIEPNSSIDLSFAPELTQSTQGVIFHDVEQKIEFLKVEDSIYLVPKNDSSIKVYKTDDGKNIIEIE